jgi:hypothetical protein
MFKIVGILTLLGAFPLISSASSSPDYESEALWIAGMRQAGYQIVTIDRTKADVVFYNCIRSCVQQDWGKQSDYNNVPRDPREWLQLSPGTAIYGFGTNLQLQDSEQAGLLFASGDRLKGSPFTPITTFRGGVSYQGFFGFAAGQPVTDLYIGYPLSGTNSSEASPGDTFSLGSILFAVGPTSQVAPEPGAAGLLVCGTIGLAVLGLNRRRRRVAVTRSGA